MKKLKLTCSVVLALAVIYLSVQIIEFSKLTKRQQYELADINDVKYGLFSVNKWKQQISRIVNEEVARFEMTKSDKKDLRPLIEAQLEKLIENVYQRVSEANKETFTGKIKQAFIETFVALEEIKKGIPEYATDVIKILDRPTSKDTVKEVLLEKVGDYFSKTFETQDMSRIDDLIKKYGQTTLLETVSEIQTQATLRLEKTYAMTWLAMGLVLLLFVIAGGDRQALSGTQYLCMVLSLVALLIAGVATPMINLEAKIGEMSFMLFDQQVKFVNQTLYFQSKSVLDVFLLMIVHPQLQMKAVGVLMVTFSVVFPMCKLMSSLFYFFDWAKLRQSRVVSFFVLKSGKWSMTDVLVIAIFMAYIGFNGIIANQFDKLDSGDQGLVLITTNGTSLQPGFFLFLAYALFALFLTEFLPKVKTPESAL